VRVEGTVERVSAAESDAYFAVRPRASQLGAWASPQSRSVANRAALAASFAEVTARFGEAEPPRPAHWGGYRVIPTALEFWQGRRSRMHDRLVYERSGEGWRLARLAP
jgi:pyridoxamine 5'-phosphate oxidase